MNMRNSTATKSVNIKMYKILFQDTHYVEQTSSSAIRFNKHKCITKFDRHTLTTKPRIFIDGKELNMNTRPMERTMPIPTPTPTPTPSETAKSSLVFIPRQVMTPTPASTTPTTPTTPITPTTPTPPKAQFEDIDEYDWGDLIWNNAQHTQQTSRNHNHTYIYFLFYYCQIYQI